MKILLKFNICSGVNRCVQRTCAEAKNMNIIASRIYQTTFHISKSDAIPGPVT